MSTCKNTSHELVIKSVQSSSETIGQIRLTKIFIIFSERFYDSTYETNSVSS